MADTPIFGNYKTCNFPGSGPVGSATSGWDVVYYVNAQGEHADVKGFSQKQLRVSGGGKIQHRVMVIKDLMLAPSLGARIGVPGLDYDSVFTTITAGLRILSTRDWDVDTALLLNLNDRGRRSMGASAKVSYRF
ncbi:hypothetical protein [Pseudomonas sp. S2_H01]